MNLKLFIFIILPLCIIILAKPSSSLSQKNQVEVNEKTQQLWEEAIDAKGGKERLHNVNSLYVVVNYGEGSYSHELYVFPDRRFTFLYWPYQETNVVHVYDGRRNISWWQNNNFPAKQGELNEDDPYQNLLAQFIYLLDTSEIKPVLLRSREVSLGLKRVDMVEVAAKGWRINYYLDQKTHLPVMVVLPFGPKSCASGEMDHQIMLDNYKEVNGIMMPHKLTHSFTFNAPKMTQSITFEVNPMFDKGIFEQMPTVKTGPETWRPANKKSGT